MESMLPEKSNPEVFIAALGIVIQRRRQELSLSQDEVAKRSGLHRTYISEIERHSRNFSLRSLLKIVEALEWQPSELMRAAEAVVAADEH